MSTLADASTKLHWCDIRWGEERCMGMVTVPPCAKAVADRMGAIHLSCPLEKSGRACLRKSSSPPAELKAKEHSCHGGTLRMYLWEKAGGTGVMRKEVHQPALGSQNVFSWLQLSPFYS